MILQEKAFNDGIIEVKCEINQEESNAVVDTGSTKSFINKNLVYRLNLTKEKPLQPVYIYTASKEK